MSGASQTRIFGIKLGIDPKFLVLGLVAVAGLLFWYNSHSGDSPSSSNTSSSTHSAVEPAATAGNGVAPTHKRAANDRRRSAHEDRLTLRLQPVAAGSGDIDPILRLDLLERLARVRPPSGLRNLFESGPAAMEGGAAAIPVREIAPKPLPLPPPGPVIQTAIPQVKIPYKYYGFARPSVPGEANRGFFMEGDDIMVAAEGQLLQQRYRIVQLTPATARLEDSQMKQEQTLPVVPEAMEQGGTAYGRQGFGQQNQMIQQGVAVNPGFPNQAGEENQP